MNYRNHLYTIPPPNVTNEVTAAGAALGIGLLGSMLGSQYIHDRHKEKMAELEMQKQSKSKNANLKNKSKKSSIKEEYLDHLYRG